MKKSHVIKLTNVSRSYKLGKEMFDVLKDINLEIYAGEYIIIFGPSGCGKSTLLNVISGLETVSSGKVEIRHEDITKLNSSQLAKYHRTKVGMVFQQFNLIKNLDVKDNIALPQVFAGIGLKRRNRRALKLLKDFDLLRLAKNLPTEMSGGQQQRVAIARALVNNPWILIADEPTGNLDSKSATEVMELFKSLNEKSKRTVLLVTHNPEYVYYAHRVLYMRDGKIIKEVVNRDIRDLETGEENKADQYKEIEKDLSESEKITKDVVGQVLRENKIKSLNEGEYRRLVRVADERRNNKITEPELQEIVDRPFKDGGVGLYKRTAEKVALALEDKFLHTNFQEIQEAQKVKENNGSDSQEVKEDTDYKINPERIATYFNKKESGTMDEEENKEEPTAAGSENNPEDDPSEEINDSVISEEETEKAEENEDNKTKE